MRFLLASFPRAGFYRDSRGLDAHGHPAARFAAMTHPELGRRRFLQQAEAFVHVSRGARGKDLPEL